MKKETIEFFEHWNLHISKIIKRFPGYRADQLRKAADLFFDDILTVEDGGENPNHHYLTLNDGSKVMRYNVVRRVRAIARGIQASMYSDDEKILRNAKVIILKHKAAAARLTEALRNQQARYRTLKILASVLSGMAVANLAMVIWSVTQ